MAGLICEQCRRLAPAGARFCPRCGVSLLAQDAGPPGVGAPPVIVTPGPRLPQPAARRCCAGGANFLILLAGMGMLLMGLRMLARERSSACITLERLTPGIHSSCGAQRDGASRDDDPGLWTGDAATEKSNRDGRSRVLGSESDEDRPVGRSRNIVRVPTH